jgi:hypothetical protein
MSKPTNHAGKIRLTRELDAFGLSIPGTCHAPTELCKAIMADPAKYVAGMVPIGSRGNWISEDPIEHDGEKYWLKIWAPDDDHLVSEATIFDRDWSKTDPWYL